MGDKFSRDLEKQLKKIERSVKKEVDGEVPASEIFSESFMRKHTKFESIEEFFDKSPFEINTSEDLEAVDDSEMDAYVREHSTFDSWDAFQTAAGEEYMGNKLKKLFK